MKQNKAKNLAGASMYQLRKKTVCIFFHLQTRILGAEGANTPSAA
jgi:hypothetical protein